MITTATEDDDSQESGPNIEQAVIEAEFAAGCTFVAATSRLWKLTDDLFEPMSLERLQAILKGNKRLKDEEQHRQLSCDQP